MSEQEAVLLGLLRPHPAAAPTPLGESAWHQVLRATPVSFHPWLAHCVERSIGMGALPPAIAAALAQARRGAAVGHLRRQAVLRQLLPALDAAGVAAVVLKGGALAYLCYPEPALRSMSDFDLWVAPAELDRAVGIAQEVGLVYSPRLRDRVAADSEPHQAKTRVLERPGSGLVFEIHGAPGSLQALSPEWIERAWHRRLRRGLGGVQAWVLHPEDMLTHVLVHCGRHDRFQGGLRPLLDVTLWLHGEDSRIDWRGLIGEWEREGVAIWALLPLRLAHELFGAPLPEEVTRRIEHSPGFDVLCETARRQVFGATLTLPPTMSRLVASTPRQRAAWVLTRLTSWYWKGPPGSRRSAARVLGDALRRMGHDVAHKTGPYLRGLLQGHYWGADFRRRKEMARGRQFLGLLVDKLESAGSRELLLPTASEGAINPTRDRVTLR